MDKSAIEIVTSVFGRRLKSKAVSILADILFVAYDIKPALLYDYSATTCQDLLTTVSRLQAAQAIPDDCRLVSREIGGDVFLFRSDSFDRLGESTTKAVIIDVSREQQNPCVISLAQANSIKRLLTAKLHVIWSGDDTAAGDTNVNYTSLFGALVGYPVLYWYEASENCLSYCPLRVFKVTATFNVDMLDSVARKDACKNHNGLVCSEAAANSSTRGQTSGSRRKEDHCSQLVSHKGADGSKQCIIIYSFSVPENVVHSGGIHSQIHQWFSIVKHRIQLCGGIFTEPELEETTVVLPHVSL